MLGLIADKHLTYASQTKELAVRARQRLGFLRRAGKYLHGKGIAKAYKAFVRPRLESIFLAWMGPAQSNLKRLDRVTCVRAHCASLKRWRGGLNHRATCPRRDRVLRAYRDVQCRRRDTRLEVGGAWPQRCEAHRSVRDGWHWTDGCV